MIILLGHLLNSMDEEVTDHLSANLGCEILYCFARPLIAGFFHMLSYKPQHLGNDHPVSAMGIVDGQLVKLLQCESSDLIN